MTDLATLMNRAAVRLATGIYRATPFRSVREAYFRSFLSLVRGRRVIRTVEGMTFDLDLGELIDVGVFLQQYERDVVDIIERVTRPGWTVLDIGANMGAHTLRFSKLVGADGRVFAFEPMEFAFSRLVRNISLNRLGNTSAINIALSERTIAAQPVSYRSSWASTGQRRAERGVVDFVKLDDWCAQNGVTQVHVIKLDVDGQEMAVLRGGLATVERWRPVLLIEAGAWHFADDRANPLGWLQARGYRFWDTRTLAETDLPGVRARLPERDAEMAFSINLVASTHPLALTPPGGRLEP